MNTTEIRQYAALLRELGLTALELRPDGTVRLEREPQATQSAVGIKCDCEDSIAPVPAAEDAEADSFIITSPMVGIFYIAPLENADPFVQTGAVVHKGEVLCIIEAMKLMNEIVADSVGVLDAVLAVNGAMVEYGQPLFRMKRAPHE